MESENFSLFADEPQWLPITDGKLLWVEHFLTPTQADHAFSVLTQELDWQQEAITLFGKSVLQPRLQAWYGDKAYTYSGLTMPPKTWTPMLADLKQRCELLAGQALTRYWLTYIVTAKIRWAGIRITSPNSANSP